MVFIILVRNRDDLIKINNPTAPMGGVCCLYGKPALKGFWSFTYPHPATASDGVCE